MNKNILFLWFKSTAISSKTGREFFFLLLPLTAIPPQNYLLCPTANRCFLHHSSAMRTGTGSNQDYRDHLQFFGKLKLALVHASSRFRDWKYYWILSGDGASLGIQRFQSFLLLCLHAFQPSSNQIHFLFPFVIILFELRWIGTNIIIMAQSLWNTA